MELDLQQLTKMRLVRKARSACNMDSNTLNTIIENFRTVREEVITEEKMAEQEAQRKQEVMNSVMIMLEKEGVSSDDLLEAFGGDRKQKKSRQKRSETRNDNVTPREN